MRWLLILVLCLLVSGCSGVNRCHCGAAGCTCSQADGSCIIIRQPDGVTKCFGR